MLWFAFGLLSLTFANAELSDAVYRDGVKIPVLPDDWHVGLIYRYDNDTGTRYVIHSAGSQSGEANSVRIGDWTEFMNYNTFMGKRCKGNPSYGIRKIIIDTALDQLNANYWKYTGMTYHWMKPNSSPGSGNGYFRCDGLVEYCYEQAGLDICNDAFLLSRG